MDSSAIRPFTPSIPSDVIADLIQRLKQTRLPEAETVEDWSQGVPLSYQAELLNYWANDYDFDRIEQRLGAFDNFVTDINGIDIHFIHARVPTVGARAQRSDRSCFFLHAESIFCVGFLNHSPRAFAQPAGAN